MPRRAYWLLVIAPALWPQETCRPCHDTAQAGTHHARSLRRLADAPEVAARYAGKTIRERTGVTLQYRPDAGGVAVTARRGESAMEAVLDWAFGAGAKAVTLVGRAAPGAFEHRLSWYAGSNQLGLSPGHPATPAPDAASALGVWQKPETLARCFNCHATGFRGLDQPFTPGVQCERCHGPGERHIALAKAGRPAARAIVNGGRMSARNAVLLCAECHRSPNPVAASAQPELDAPDSIRFAPVGFLASRCFQKSKNFSCQSCHRPHEDLAPASNSRYAQVCISCHAVRPSSHINKNCPRGPDCVACHMRQDEPLPQLKFTDHRIRILPAPGI